MPKEIISTKKNPAALLGLTNEKPRTGSDLRN